MDRTLERRVTLSTGCSGRTIMGREPVQERRMRRALTLLVPTDSRAMIRFRNLAIVAVIATAVYALVPAARKARFLDKLREFGRALVISLVLYWLLIIGRSCFRELTARGQSTPHRANEENTAEAAMFPRRGELSPRDGGAKRCTLRVTFFGGEGKPLPAHPTPAALRAAS